MLINIHTWIRREAQNYLNKVDNSDDYDHIWQISTSILKKYNPATLKIVEREIYLLEIELAWGLETRKKYEELVDEDMNNGKPKIELRAEIIQFPKRRKK